MLVITTSTPFTWERLALWIMSLSRVTCSGFSSRAIRSETTLRFAPRASRKAAARKSLSVVDGKVNEPVSS